MKAGRTLMDLGFWCLPPAISHQVRRDLPSRLCPRVAQRGCRRKRTSRYMYLISVSWNVACSEVGSECPTQHSQEHKADIS